MYFVISFFKKRTYQRIILGSTECVNSVQVKKKEKPSFTENQSSNKHLNGRLSSVHI